LSCAQCTKVGLSALASASRVLLGADRKVFLVDTLSGNKRLVLSPSMCFDAVPHFRCLGCGFSVIGIYRVSTVLVSLVGLCCDAERFGWLTAEYLCDFPARKVCECFEVGCHDINS
jgi:hypothetical protein